ncbi:hypothetical protein A8C40_00355 [Ligilactobacillus salivarius]|nr:hypothetical protein A8C40_00355 [Ligilactobacillus salivarius]
MIKINKQAFNKICKEIDELAINRRSKAMGVSKGVYEISPDDEVSITIFLKDENLINIKRVSTLDINDKWLKVYYFNESKKQKSTANFRVDNPDFIGYTAAAPEFDEEEI